MDDSKTAGETGEGEKIGRGCGFGCLGVVLFAILVFAWSAIQGGDDRPGTGAAEVACENLVRDQLKSPSTAKFSNVEATGTGPWTVTGAVDSQNSFGATVRTTWTCRVQSTGGDRFEGTVRFDE